jgi:hypothetical protein
MRWLSAILFIVCVLVIAFLVVRLNDWMQRQRLASSAARREEMSMATPTPDIQGLEAFFGQPLPDELKKWNETPRVLQEPLQLPPPNADLFVTEMLPLNPAAMSSLGWKGDLPYVPIAALEDGDLLVVALGPTPGERGSVLAYFHDGGKFERLFSGVTQFLQALRFATSGRE